MSNKKPSLSNAKQLGIVAGLIVLILLVGLTQLNSYPPLEKTITSALVDRRGNEMSVTELQTKDYVLVYFSASWCPPCRKFTPELVKFYKEHSDTRNFEVVFVSSDRSRSEMKDYMKKYRMPWLAVKYSSYRTRTRLKKLYGGRGGIPNLVILNSSGKVLASSYKGGSYIGPQKVLERFESL